MKLLKYVLSGVVAVSLVALGSNNVFTTKIASVPNTLPISSNSDTKTFEINTPSSNIGANLSQIPTEASQETSPSSVYVKDTADIKPEVKATSNNIVTAAANTSKASSAPSKSTTSTTGSSTAPVVQAPKQEERPISQVPSPAPEPASNPVPEAPKPAPPSKPSSSKLVLGYGTFYSNSDVSSLNSLKAHSTIINTLATHTYITDVYGNLNIQGNVFPSGQVSFANSNGIKTLAVVRNEFDGKLAHDILNNPSATANLINNIEKSLAAHNYNGVNIDFEILYSNDRDVFTSFMKDLYNRLKPKGYLVTIALPAKTSESEKWVYAYDYAKLGGYSDQVILMTYDEHYPGGMPGPVASLNWTQRVVNYAASVIPREKLLLGLAAYGYDWTVKDGKTISTKSVSVASAYSVASSNSAQVLWDSAAQVPYYTYTDSKGEHFVYFENSTSISYKLNIVNNSNLKGIAIWRLGLEDEAYWTTIKTKLNK
jgi:spore germination protein YaaH